MKEIVLKSFLEVRDGRSADAIVADPDLNARFIEKCRIHGAAAAPCDLNFCLLNLRKTRALEDLPTTKRIRLRGQDDYRFAAEIAARFLELRDHVSLDRIICDPLLAAEFDKLAAELAPGHSSFEYRFTALSLRKQSGLAPEIVSRVVAAIEVKVFRAAGLNILEIPRTQGIYILFFKKEGVLYVGEANNLRDRLRKHLDHSDRKEIARWLWEKGSDDLYVEIHILPDDTKVSVRKAVELELIRSRRPRFNVLGAEQESE